MDWGFESSTRRRTCMLMITHACNLNCSYCYEPYKENAYMSVDLAKDIVSREAQFVSNSDRFDELQIEFMGGEPFTNFDLIRELVEWLEKGAINVPWICYSSTNGTLLTNEIKDWLQEHNSSLVVGASYDGNIEMQSTNRGTDDHSIDLELFHKMWPFQPLHMTISKETLPKLAEGVLYMQKKGYEVEAALAQGVDWTIEDAVVYREQLCILKDAYLKDTSINPFNVLKRFTYIFDSSSEEKIQEKWCGTGKQMATYDVDGRKYGCHMFTPLVLGENRVLLSDRAEWDSPKSTVDEYCKDCVLRNFCPTCPGFNYRYRGDIAIRDKRWCPMVLAEALTACEFQVERIAAMDNLDKKDAQHGQAALIAYKAMQHLDLERSTSPYTN